MADLMETAAQVATFSTLVAAVRAAGLADTLKGPGPFTVFAPTDAAFAKLPPGAVARLLADRPRLADVLTYHVVPGRVMAADVVRLDEARTVQGQPLAIDSRDAVCIGAAMVMTTDIVADNGVIHGIDTVLLPD